MKREPSPTQRAIRQATPFRSVGQEAVVALLLAAERVKWPYQDLLAAQGDLTLQQYNVLRILRGAGAAGLATLEIAERMLERAPGITRLLDRLEDKGLIARERSSADRRQVTVRITRAGRDLLGELDAPFDRLDDQVLSELSQAEMRTLTRLLERLHRG
ncbi:MAG: MarR family transcriptional regulator [Planctomycetes bacterium]|nr:MarR family transcriptional regulator [Planctomycetota bacterium]